MAIFFLTIMAIENIHGIEVKIEDGHSDSIKKLIYGWKNHETDFKEMCHSVGHDPNNKIYIGNIVFEKRDGRYILRKSSSSN